MILPLEKDKRNIYFHCGIYTKERKDKVRGFWDTRWAMVRYLLPSLFGIDFGTLRTRAMIFFVRSCSGT